MIEFSVVEAFAVFLDKIADLVRARQQDKQQFFKEIVEPLFVELGPVVDNYFILFRNAKESVSASSPTKLGQAVRGIRTARDVMIMNRIRVREMAKVIQESYRDKNIQNFAAKVESFFYPAVVDKSTGKKSHAAELVDLCDYVLKENMKKDELLKYIDDTLQNMESSWVEISRLYGALRIHCLTSPTFSKP